MTFSLVLATLVCFTTWMSTVHATHGPESNCCSQLSTTRVRPNKIQDYTIQSEGICSITAIVFQTKVGKRICSDPNNDWVKKTMQTVDENKKLKALQERSQNEDGSTSDITPAVSITSKNAPQQRGRNGRRRQRKKARGGRKAQRKCA